MKAFILFSALLLTAISFLGSCAKDKVQPLKPIDFIDTVSFSQKIMPLIQPNCATSGCHDAGTAADGRNLSTYEGISANANDMLNAMRGQGPLQPMPQGAPLLPMERVDEFQAWISQGKLNN